MPLDGCRVVDPADLGVGQAGDGVDVDVVAVGFGEDVADLESLALSAQVPLSSIQKGWPAVAVMTLPSMVRSTRSLVPSPTMRSVTGRGPASPSRRSVAQTSSAPKADGGDVGMAAPEAQRRWCVGC